jgi:hypothetical protein
MFMFEKTIEHDLVVGNYTISIQTTVEWVEGALTSSVYYLVFDGDGYDVFDNADWGEVLKFCKG